MSNFFQFCMIEDSWASEDDEYDFFNSEVLKFISYW